MHETKYGSIIAMHCSITVVHVCDPPCWLLQVLSNTSTSGCAWVIYVKLLVIVLMWQMWWLR